MCLLKLRSRGGRNRPAAAGFGSRPAGLDVRHSNFYVQNNHSDISSFCVVIPT